MSGNGDDAVVDVSDEIVRNQYINQPKNPSSSSSAAQQIQIGNVDLRAPSPKTQRLHTFTAKRSLHISTSLESDHEHTNNHDPAEEDDDDGMLYAKVNTRKTRYTRFCIEWIITLFILCLLVASFILDKLQNISVWGNQIWKWCVFLIVMLRGVMAATWCTYFLLCTVTLRNSSRRRNVQYFFLGMKKTVWIFTWLLLVLLTWLLFFRRGPGRQSKISGKIIHYVIWTLASLLIGSFLWLLKTILLKFLASRFYLAAFFDRIQESIFHQYVIYKLSGPERSNDLLGSSTQAGSSRLSFRKTEMAKAGKEKDIIYMKRLVKLKKDEVSAEAMEVLVNAVCSTGLSIMYDSFDDMDEGKEPKDKELSSEVEAMSASYYIFRNVARPGCKFLYDEDLHRYVTKNETDLLLPLFEGTNNGKINKKSMTDWVVKIYNVRKGLIHSLTDTKKSIKQLDALVSGILIVVATIAWLLVAQIATTNVLLFISSQLVLAAFIFGDTCKRVFESVLFLFLLHPYDVGDRCVINDVLLMVEKINILTTVFLTLNNEIIYYPNSVLSTMPILNLNRSNLGDVVQFSIASTPEKVIADLRAKIKTYLEKNPRYWSTKHNLVVTEIENGKSKVALYFNYVVNFQEFGEKTKRRSELVIDLMEIFKDLNIKFSVMAREIAVVPFN